MPIHDWTRVEAGIFHDFHHALIEQIKRDLNTRVPPCDYYALAEQYASGFGPDVLTLSAPEGDSRNELNDDNSRGSSSSSGQGVLIARPQASLIAETEMEFYRRKQNRVTVRHVSGDRIVAVIEVVSQGNKSTSNALKQFVEKAAEFLDGGVDLLIVDLFPPGRHDPGGIHGAIWEFIDGQGYTPPIDKPLTLAAYESDLAIRAYVEPVAVADKLVDMPLFLERGGCVLVPLEVSYGTAWEAFPRRWKNVLESQK
jgi:hypothetical protein